MEKAIVMNKAWEIAREGVEKFGGKVKEYFAKALKIAWALIKKEEKQMDQVNGFEIKERNYSVNGWEKHGHRRVYFEGYFIFVEEIRGNAISKRVDFKGYWDIVKGRLVFSDAPARHEEFIKDVLRNDINAKIVEMDNANAADEGENDFGMKYEGY